MSRPSSSPAQFLFKLAPSLDAQSQVPDSLSCWALLASGTDPRCCAVAHLEPVAQRIGTFFQKLARISANARGSTACNM